MISIVIPVYNSEDFLGVLYNSLINQTFKDFEVIFIDDGSIDKSLLILEGFQEEEKINIKILKQENKGPSCARNEGIKVAKGKWICFIDSDDFISSEYLYTMMNDLLDTNADLAVCYINPFTEHKNIKQPNDGGVGIGQVQYKNEVMKGFLYNKLKISITAILIDKKIIVENNIMFNELYKHSEDTEFIWKVLSNTNKIVINKAALYFYRLREGSLTTSFSADNLKGIELIDNLIEYIELHSPEVSHEFSSFATANARIYKLKEAVLGSDSYKDFKSYEELIEGKRYVKRLFKFPLMKVKLMSILYYSSSFSFYWIVKIFYYKSIKKGVDS